MLTSASNTAAALASALAGGSGGMQSHAPAAPGQPSHATTPIEESSPILKVV